MDSLTHIVLGGCMGEAVAGKQLGRKALALGALAQSLPDIDFVASFWLNPANDLLAHRGFTHSFLFILLTAPMLGFIADRYIRQMKLSKWILFFALQMFIHVFLDAFNSYGVGWFEPFSHVRISFNILFVADPFLSVPLAVAFGFLALASMKNERRMIVALAAIAWWAVYLGYGIVNKISIDSNVRKNIEAKGIVATDYFSTPTPLNNWLWYVVVNSESGSFVGYRSVFDTREEIDFEYFDRSEELLSPVSDHEDLQHLRRFSQGFYTAEMWGDTLVFNDLRFGQMIGWKNRRGKFVFHYYLSHPDDNHLLVQRGRFEGWDEEATRSLLKRIAGD